MTQDMLAGSPAGTRARSNVREYSVSDLAFALKRSVEEQYGHVRVRGEISRPNFHASGHCYLTLKDDKAVLNCVCWRTTMQRLRVRPEDGMEVIVTGQLTTYPGKSQYQLVIDTVELAGRGALLKLLEDRRQRLAAEGLFAPERKRKLPFLPTVIGVVTSPSGAVIRDILHRLADRFPRRVLLWPVPVQGELAAEKVAEAIRGFNAMPAGGRVPRPDVLIVARGGGSLEDLMAFNEEIVVRAAAESRIPVIAAVGHETDTTLIDHAADRRAPTPTAAAEMAVPVRADLAAMVLDRERRRLGCLAALLERKRERLAGLARGLPDPARLLDGALQRLDDRAERLARCVPHRVERCQARVTELGARLLHPRARLAEAARHLGHWAERLPTAPVRRVAEAGRQLDATVKLLESYSYKDVLRRGYAVILDPGGKTIGSVEKTKAGDPVTIRFADGDTPAMIGGVLGKRTRPAKPGQGKLF